MLEWLRDPERHFPPQRDGDLVRDGVCSSFIAEMLGVSEPTCGEHLKISSGSPNHAWRPSSSRERHARLRTVANHA